MKIDPSMILMRSSEDEVRTRVGTTQDAQPWGFVAKRPTRRVPLFIPRDQAYYWTQEWQDSVQSTYAGLEAGEYMDFDDRNDPDAVVRWLLSDED